jgi:hypothetical protein
MHTKGKARTPRTVVNAGLGVVAGRAGAARLAVATCLLLAAAVCAAGQDAPSPDARQEITMTDLLKLPGKVIARGGDGAAQGKFRLRSYRVEEVALPRPQELELRGVRVAVTKAFRVTLEGGPFPVRALPPVVWIDDAAVGFGVESEDLDEITAVTFDESVLRDGATIYLSYGDKKNKQDRSALGVKLKLDAGKDRP